MFGRRTPSLKELIRLQHEELRLWDEESRRRQENWTEAMEKTQRAVEEFREFNREILQRNGCTFSHRKMPAPRLIRQVQAFSLPGPPWWCVPVT